MSRLFISKVVLTCDGKCTKAWGIGQRPKIILDENDQNDFAWLADHELGDAPADPGTYENGYAKPSGPHDMNTWCVRECERSEMRQDGDAVTVRVFSQRVYNQPWKHGIDETAGVPCQCQCGSSMRVDWRMVDTGSSVTDTPHLVCDGCGFVEAGKQSE